jgi:pimeloyl-ACP methyl ester carboxylesterase
MAMFHDLRNAALTTGSALWRGALERSGASGAELARRAALARMPSPEGIAGPPLRLLLGELRAVVPKGLGSLAPVPAARPRPVMLLPGFGAHPVRMRRLLRGLGAAGHRAHEWGLGFNLGPTPENFAFLLGRLTALAKSEGEPVVLIGWSLGGLFARELAKQRPETVAGVITLGSPFSGDRRANNAWRAYQFVTGHRVDEPPVPGDFAIKPPVPTIALWSPRDGIVAPRSACGWPGERDRAVALRCNHLGFANDPAVIAEVLRQVDSI